MVNALIFHISNRIICHVPSILPERSSVFLFNDNQSPSEIIPALAHQAAAREPRGFRRSLAVTLE